MTRSHIRRAVVAGRFYEGSPGALERSAHRCINNYTPPDDLGELTGGIVPHAGWVFSGATAAKVFCALAQKAQPDVYVLLGAMHSISAGGAAVYPDGAWETPLGQAAVDAALASAIAEESGGLISISASAHDHEHSIEVQVPLIQVLSPQAAIVPVAVPPGDDAVAVGEVIAGAAARYDGKVVLIASSDLTHYGMGYGMADRGPWATAALWMRENDMRIVRLVENLQAEDICPEAYTQRNACGAGAMAAATSAARKLGATRGRILEYTTSADVMGETDADRAVGYVGMVFEKGCA